MDRVFKSLISVIFGNFIYALTVTVFLFPSELVTGGTTGIALTVNHIWDISISGFVFVFNVSMLFIGLAAIGKSFAITTLASTFLYPFFLEVCKRMVGNLVLTNDLLLCTVFSGLGIGIALGIVIRSGASTGGMDIPPLVLNKLFRIPVSVGMYAFDFCILLMQVFKAFSSLLEKKRYENITVQEIIDKADIGRSTFYAHFETKDELLRAMCMDIFHHVFTEALPKEANHDYATGSKNHFYELLS